MEFSSRHIDYLSRAYLDESAGRKPIAATPQSIFSPNWQSLTLMRLSGISRFWERVRSDRDPKDQSQHRYRMEDVLIGCHGVGLPMMFLVTGHSTSPEIGIYMGSLEPSNITFQKYEPEVAIHFISRSLPGHYPGIQAVSKQNEEISILMQAKLVRENLLNK